MAKPLASRGQTRSSDSGPHHTAEPQHTEMGETYLRINDKRPAPGRARCMYGLGWFQLGS